MDTLSHERQEAEVAFAARNPSDPISTVVGSPLYSAHHRFPDLRMDVMASGALGVSRFYFQAGVVVDIIEHPRRFQAEIARKRQYCKEHGLRYVLVTDAFDDEGVRKQLEPARVRPTGSRPRTTADAKPVRKPRTRKVPA
jgi:hypothetical protein